MRPGDRVFVALAFLNLAAWLPAQPPPSADEQEFLSQRIRQTALRFRGQLPDFTATEQEVRWIDSSGMGKWKKRDTLELQISFSQDGRTGVKLLKIDGKPAKRPYDRETGAKDPEFLHGAILPTHLFAPRPDPQFVWIRWDSLGGRRVAVLSFRAKPVTNVNGFLLGFHGVVYADPADGMPLRLEVQTDAPAGFGFDESGWDADYAPVTLSGRELVLPVRAVTHYHGNKAQWKNEIQLSGYRKYEADSTVKFDQ